MKSMKNTMKCLVAVFIMAMTFAVTGITAEAAVTNMKQTDDSTTSIDMQFVTVSSHRYYGIRLYADAACTSLVKQDYTTTGQAVGLTEEFWISGLTAGRTYYAKIGYGDSYSTCYNDMSGAIEVVTAPTNMQAAWVNSNDTQVGLQVYAPGANWYAIYGSGDTYIGRTNILSNTAPVTLAVPATAAAAYYYVYPCRSTSTGSYTAVGYSDSVYAEPLTTKIPKKNFGLSYVSKSSKTMTVGASYYGSGYEVQVQNAGSSKYNKTGSSTSTYADVSYKANRYLKYRVRAYVDTDAGRVYGNWSDYRAFAAMSGKYTPKYKSVALKWSKVKGSGKIKIQVSTKKDTKYKKFKTLKGSAKSVTVNKYGKKNLGSRKWYYVRIVPQVKIGKKYVDSDYYLQQYFRTR